MVEENWEEWFAPWILERGLNYWKAGKVQALYQDEEEERITATVLGTEEYEVNISLECGEIVEMDCTYPHAENGNYCKHTAVSSAIYEESAPIQEETMQFVHWQHIGRCNSPEEALCWMN